MFKSRIYGLGYPHGQNPLVQDENGLRTLFSGSGQITHDDTDGFVANEHIDHTSVTLTAGPRSIWWWNYCRK